MNPKFRVWHKEEKIMTKPFDLVDITDGYDNGHEIAADNSLLGHYPFHEDDRFTIMQGSGLHDRNGTDIYEGDLLALIDEVHDQPLYLQQAFFTEGAFFISHAIDIKACWWFLHSCLQKYDVQIVGNIYQNPELIGKTNEQPG